MEIYQKKDKTNDAVNRIVSKRHLHFMKKNNRDRAFMLIKKAGLNAKKTSRRNQEIHPVYVEDYVGEIEEGFGNTMYRTYFPVLYNIEITNLDKRRNW